MSSMRVRLARVPRVITVGTQGRGKQVRILSSSRMLRLRSRVVKLRKEIKRCMKRMSERRGPRHRLRFARTDQQMQWNTLLNRKELTVGHLICKLLMKVKLQEKRTNARQVRSTTTRRIIMHRSTLHLM